MEKYGVWEEEPTTKTAGDKPHCKDCGEVLRPPETTGVLICPKCGSRPYERDV